MELKDLFDILRKHGVLLLLTTAFFAVTALVGSMLLPPRYTALVSLYVTRRAAPPSEDFYTYDGYYAQQAAERYTDTVVGLLQSKSLLREVLLDLELPKDHKVLRKMEKKVVVKRVAPQIIKMEVQKRWEDEFSWDSASLAEALSKKVVERVEELNAQGGDENLSVSALGAEPLVEVQEPNLFLNTVVAALLGFLVSFFIVTARSYFED